MAQTVVEPRMTEFGKHLYALLLRRGIEYRGDLADMLTSGGYPLSRSQLSNYLIGRRKVPWLFVRCVEEVLDLSPPERRVFEKLHLDENAALHTTLTEKQEKMIANFAASR